MKISIDIDDNLILKAQKLTKIKAKKAVIEKALQLLIQLESQNKLLELCGKIEIDDEAFK